MIVLTTAPLSSEMYSVASTFEEDFAFEENLIHTD